MFLTIIVFIVILGVLIFVHEFGHFAIAKLTGVEVEEFAFGFPPRLVSWKYKGTIYAINLIPLGGYVKLLGEEGEDEVSHIKSPKAFVNKSVATRIYIVVAGVIMNFILAIFLMTIGFSIGMTPLVSDPSTMTGIKESQVMVTQVLAGSAAAKAGILTNDILNGFSSITDLQTYTHAHAGQTVNLSVLTNRQIKEVSVTLSTDLASPLGVSIASITKVKQPVGRALVTSVSETGKAIGALFSFLWGIIKSFFTTGHAGAAAEGVVGPVGLFNFTAQALKIGWIYVLQLVVLLSINLGIINILPFPALDGGKVLFLTLEGIFRRKIIRQEIENIIHLIGFALLILLLIAITFRDVSHFKFVAKVIKTIKKI